MKRYWLRKRNTFDIEPWTQTLSERADMDAVSEEEAMRCVKLAAEKLENDRRSRIEGRTNPAMAKAQAKRATQTPVELKREEMQALADKGLVPPEAVPPASTGPKTVDIDHMDAIELAKFAEDHKIALSSSGAEDRRNEIKEALGIADEPEPVASAAGGDTPSATTFDDMDDATIAALSRPDLVKAAKHFGVPPKGSNEALAAKIAEVRAASQ